MSGITHHLTNPTARQLAAEVVRLRNVLAALVDTGTLDSEYEHCVLCGDDYALEFDDHRHQPDCPWIRAHHVLGRDLPKGHYIGETP